MEAILLRGISGAGKSTWIKKHRETLGPDFISYVFSADDFFNTADGWIYDRSKQGDAHNWAFKEYAAIAYDIEAMRQFGEFAVLNFPENHHGELEKSFS